MNMHIKTFFLVCSLISNLTFAQRWQYRPRKDRVAMVGSVGLGIGGENLVSFPKLSGFASLKLGKKRNNWYGGFQKNALYAGAEVSIFVLFAGAFSGSVTSGFKLGRLTMDCSLTRLILSSPESVIVARETTLNPKLGGVFGPVWFKVGPCISLSQDYVFRDMFGGFLHAGRFALNIEVNFISD